MIRNMRAYRTRGPIHAVIHGKTICGRPIHYDWTGTSRPVTCRPCRVTVKRWFFRQGIFDR